TPPFAFVELGDADAEVIVRGDAVVRADAEEVSGAGATTWIERRLPSAVVTVALTGEGELELPIESGVVRGSAFASGSVPLPTSAKPAPASTPAPTPAPAPEPASPASSDEAFPDFTIP